MEEKILYIDCFSGISGDMFIGALLDLGLDRKRFEGMLKKILPRGTNIEIWEERRGNFVGKRFEVKEQKEEKERKLKDIKKILRESNLDRDILIKAEKMFEELAEVEAKIHGVSKEQIHFHELGAIDSIADIVGSIIGLKLLGVKKVYFSKINVGMGSVVIKHGRVPLPVPATLELLRRAKAPIYSTGINSELVTPTGALIIRHFVDSYGMPLMRVNNIGIGFGSRILEGNSNFLRAILGVLEEKGLEEVLIETNIDDMNPEFFPLVEEKLFKEGALEVYRTPIQMKKGRPGFMLSILCRKEDIHFLTEILFRETTTIGVRIKDIERIKLNREVRKIKTPLGKAEVKLSYLRGKLINVSPEYESCKKIAEKRKIPLKEVYEMVKTIAKSSLKNND
ncbi:MAG: nickel pincer cofactor biosynthesis protein LarC [candidate division WOR-3 bacterium]